MPSFQFEFLQQFFRQQGDMLEWYCNVARRDHFSFRICHIYIYLYFRKKTQNVHLSFMSIIKQCIVVIIATMSVPRYKHRIYKTS